MAHRKASESKAEIKNTGGKGGEENTPNVQADQNSIAVGGFQIGGDVTGTITIGHGYTAEQVSLLLKQITTTLGPKPFDGRCPYKGLEVFEEGDAELFFGRERLVDDLISRVKESRTVFITGPSGSGKSSLVRAGLIHALKQGAIKNLHSERWLYETMKPGREPLKELALAFSRLKSPELANYFRSHASEVDILNECAESVLSGQKDQRFVLFVDQFEEVFTQINQEEERLSFLNMLAHAGTVENGRVIVLFAMRSDFLSNCATYPAVNELLSQQFRQIGAMRPEELVSAIALPAKHVGLPIEDELIARIINDMKGEPGALPLMQFALKDLFDAQQEKGGVIALTLEDYLKHGGIHKSLERHADKSFATLSENEQELARSIFSGLIEIGRGTSDTRRTALFNELIPANAKATEVESVVQRLADARLIITDEQAGKDTVTISHEKLIDAWPWLKKLVNENREVIALQNEIKSDAKEWDDHKRDSSYLYTGARLAIAREQLEAKKLVLSGTANDFVQAGLFRQQRDRHTRILSIAGVISLIIAAIILFSYISTTNSKKLAEQSNNSANTQAALASTSQAIAITAQANADEAQKQTNIALARQLAAQAQYVDASGNSKQLIADLLATQSMRQAPTGQAAQILLNNNFAARLIARMTHDDHVYAVTFSPNGRYVVSSSVDGTARVWEAATGKEIARITYERSAGPVAFSPDGNYVVSGGCDEFNNDGFTCKKGSARVWEAATGREVARMTHEGTVNSVIFSPDGNYVVSSSADRTARVWEVATGKEVARMTHEGFVGPVAFSPDGQYLVSGGCDEVDSDGYTCTKSSTRVLEIATGKEVTRMTHEGLVRSISPDGNHVVAGSDDRTITVWEIATGKEVAHMTHEEFVRSVDFSPDGKYVVSSSNDSLIHVWETATGQEVARMTHGLVNSIAFSPDGKYVVSGSRDNTARVWETASGQEVARMTHDDVVSTVAFSSDGKYVVSGSEDNTARVWEAATGAEVARLTHDGTIHSVAFNSDGNYMVLGSGDNTASVWETTTWNEVARMNHEGEVYSVAFSPDGKYVVSGSDDDTARVWLVATGEEIARMTHDDRVLSVAFSPDGKYVVSGSDDDTARVWEAATGVEIARKTHISWVRSVAFSPDGRYVVSGSADGTALMWDTTTGKEVARMIHDGPVNSVAFSLDGSYVVSGSDDGTARVWKTTTGEEMARMTHRGLVTSVAFSRDGKYVVSGSNADNTARVWEAATGVEVARMTHDDWVYAVAFSPDGKYVVSGSYDNTARVWEAATGVEVARMIHDHWVIEVTFSPDGKYVVSAGVDNTARIWSYRPDDLISNACAHLPRNLTRDEWKQYIGNALPYQAVCSNLQIEPEEIQTPSPMH